MRILFVSLLCLFNCFAAIAQPTMSLWGISPNGGTTNTGTIFSLDSNGNNLQTFHSFSSSTPGAQPYRGKLLYTNGRFWGMTRNGGDGYGAIFSWDPSTNHYEQVFNFSSVTGINPEGGLIEYNGKLYGLTGGGGDNSKGTLFEWDMATSVFTKKYSFITSAGATPYGSLTLYNNKLYGMANLGGLNNLGVIFEWDPATNIYTKKIDLSTTSGSRPYGSLTLFNNKLYGMTNRNGASNNGVIFEWDPATNIYTKKIDLNITSTGSAPYGTMIVIGSKLYGFTRFQGRPGAYGCLFEWDPATNIFINKTAMYLSATNAGPEGDPSYYSVNGKFYAPCFAAGPLPSVGGISEYDTAADTCIQRFACDTDSSGANPRCTMAEYNGKFYGTMSTSGKGREGVLFEFDPVSFSYTRKIDFNYSVNGVIPNCSLSYFNGRYFGTTSFGGLYGKGVLFEYMPSTGNYVVKYNFIVANGMALGNASWLCPYNGKLYGVTYGGGVNNAGVLFEYDPENNLYTKKYDFNTSGTTEGYNPFGGLSLFNGKLYGTTDAGAANSKGSLFEYDPALNSITKKIDLNTTSTGNSIYSPMKTYNGMLYGTASVGGTGSAGTLFEYNPVTNIYTKKYDMVAVNGSVPYGGLVLYNNLFYGFASSGGVNSAGVIFEWNPVSNTYTKKYDFNNSSGTAPNGSPLLVNDRIYGLTQGAGNKGLGTIFQWDITNNIFTKKLDFTTANGGMTVPVGTALLYAPNAQQSMKLCPGGNTQAVSFVTGSTYQWQLDTGSGFANISDNINYTGTNSNTLTLINVPSAWYGYEYQCVVDGTTYTKYKLKFENSWTGAVDVNWGNIGNWSCGFLPDANTDVVIKTGPVVVDINGICRTLTINPSVNFSVNTGVNLTITH